MHNKPSVNPSQNEELLRVRITLPGAPANAALITPGGGLRWGRCIFEINPAEFQPCDFWIVHAYAFPSEQALVAPHNTLFIAGEPPAKKIHARAFYRQFHHLIDTHGASGHPRLNLGAPALGWRVGLNLKTNQLIYGYDYLKQLPRPPKQNRVAVICSNTAKKKGQRKRLEFLEALKVRLGDQIVHFGKGFDPIDDKLDGILPYRFQLVLENSISPHYWTEKLADAYMGWAFPLYVGSPNVNDYFPPEALQPLDMEDVDGAVKIITRLLATPVSEVELRSVEQARETILDVYSPCAQYAAAVEKWYAPGPKKLVTIRSYKAFRFLRGWLYRLKHRKSVPAVV